MVAILNVLRAAAGAGLLLSPCAVRAADVGNSVGAPPGAWVGTWAASPQPIWNPEFFAPITLPRSVRDVTIRQIARISMGGSAVRIVLSNEYGWHPLMIGSAHIAIAGNGSTVVTGTDHALTFGGKSSAVIPAGAPLVSDPVSLPVPALGSVAVTLYLPQVTPLETWHNDGRQTAYISEPGNYAGDTDFKVASTTHSRVFLSEIMVDAAPDARAIVLFGDSITDGDGSTPDANHRWPDFLAERLQKEGHRQVAVLNEGISGARVLADRMGVNALARFDEDVLSQPHADTVVLMMGINDIGWPDTLLAPHEPAPSVDDITAGYRQLVARAHMRGWRIFGATLTPFEDTFHGTPLYGYYSEAKEAKREAVNQFIRTSGIFDGVIDFDAVARDPADPKHISPKLDSGDHLHPKDDGYRAMAQAVDLTALTQGAAR